MNSVGSDMTIAKAEIEPSPTQGFSLREVEGPVRRGRKRRVRSRSIRVARASKSEVERARARLEDDLFEHARPRRRSECAEGLRPCPHVGCKHHLYLDVSPLTGTIKLNFPDLEVWEMSVSCALDIAESGGVRLEDVGLLLNITRERARQIESKALAKLETLKDLAELRDYAE